MVDRTSSTVPHRHRQLCFVKIQHMMGCTVSNIFLDLFLGTVPLCSPTSTHCQPIVQSKENCSQSIFQHNKTFVWILCRLTIVKHLILSLFNLFKIRLSNFSLHKAFLMVNSSQFNDPFSNILQESFAHDIACRYRFQENIDIVQLQYIIRGQFWTDKTSVVLPLLTASFPNALRMWHAASVVLLWYLISNIFH